MFPHQDGACGKLTQTVSPGATIPNTTFTYVPWMPELDSGKACGVPTSFQSHDRWKGKKVVIIAVPGAFTPTCHVNHIPPFVGKIDEFKRKGVDEIAVVAANDPFVMSAWGVANHAQDKVLFASDFNASFSKELDAVLDMTDKGFGVRTARYALIVDDLKVVDFAEDKGDLDQSSAETVLGKL